MSVREGGEAMVAECGRRGFVGRVFAKSELRGLRRGYDYRLALLITDSEIVGVDHRYPARELGRSAPSTSAATGETKAQRRRRMLAQLDGERVKFTADSECRGTIRAPASHSGRQVFEIPSACLPECDYTGTARYVGGRLVIDGSEPLEFNGIRKKEAVAWFRARLLAGEAPETHGEAGLVDVPHFPVTIHGRNYILTDQGLRRGTASA